MTARLTNIDSSSFIVANTGSETEIASLVMPANGLASGRAARLTVVGGLFNNSGAEDTVLFKVKLGSTTVLTSSAATVTASSNDRPWRLVVEVAAESDDLQRVSGLLSIAEPLSANFPLSEWSADGITGVGYGTSAEDGTGTVDFSVTVTLGSADTALHIVKRFAMLEQLGMVSGWTATDVLTLPVVSTAITVPQVTVTGLNHVTVTPAPLVTAVSVPQADQGDDSRTPVPVTVAVAVPQVIRLTTAARDVPTVSTAISIPQVTVVIS